MYSELLLCLVLFLHDFINNISVTHRLKSMNRVGKICICTRIVEAVEGFFLADVQLLSQHQNDACLFAPAYRISHRVSGVRLTDCTKCRQLSRADWLIMQS